MSVSEKAITAVIKFGLIFILMIVMSVLQTVKAQDKDWDVPRFLYSGLEASFGVKSSTITSGVEELDGMALLQEGGNAGFVFGTAFSRVSVKPLGFYSASSTTGRTINLYSLEVENNTYLLSGLMKRPVRFDVYSLLGLNFQSYKFFGHYIDEDLRPNYNNKIGKEPYLGKIQSMMITAGLGVEYKLSNNSDFVNIFFAGKYNMPMQITTDSEPFQKTTIENNFDISLGLRFGLVDVNRNFLR